MPRNTEVAVLAQLQKGWANVTCELLQMLNVVLNKESLLSSLRNSLTQANEEVTWCRERACTCQEAGFALNIELSLWREMSGGSDLHVKCLECGRLNFSLAYHTLISLAGLAGSGRYVDPSHSVASHRNWNS
eukprot:3041509-Amphidinium_carterae.2